MTITYRTTGTWGAGKGANLTAAEVDNNFYDLDQRVTAVEDNPAEPVQISNITSSGSALTITMDNGDTYGPLTLPSAAFLFRGEWAGTTAYNRNDVVSNGGNLYFITADHTSASTFDPARVISGVNVYQLMIEGGAGGGGGGGGGETYYDVYHAISGTPSANQKVIIPFVRDMVFAFDGTAVCGTAPTSSKVISVKINSTEFMTINFNAGTTIAYFVFLSEDPTVFGYSDRLVFDFPASVDATWANVGINMIFTPPEV